MWYGNYSKSFHKLNDCSIIGPVNIDIADLMIINKCGQTNEGSTSGDHLSNLFKTEEGKLLQRWYLSTSQSYWSFIVGIITIGEQLDNYFIIPPQRNFHDMLGLYKRGVLAHCFLTETCVECIEPNFHKLIWPAIKTPSLKGRLP